METGDIVALLIFAPFGVLVFLAICISAFGMLRTLWREAMK